MWLSFIFSYETNRKSKNEQEFGLVKGVFEKYIFESRLLKRKIQSMPYRLLAKEMASILES
ncbi:MAG: hypothetical protein CVU92_01680 [Firmicutes bacterium HGW-Firmicutes-17]|jgi:hypothetical protein|nr:MAG: hypothetical protein CVU92_01680 [Firmicutes bacterium HGW-Firmicutes-17]